MLTFANIFHRQEVHNLLSELLSLTVLQLNESIKADFICFDKDNGGSGNCSKNDL